MAGVLKVEVVESAQQLKEMLEKQRDATGRSKIQLLWWLKTAQANQINQLARLSGYHRTTVSRWLSKYRQGGLDALLEVRPKPGRPTAITGKIRQQLVRVLKIQKGSAATPGSSRVVASSGWRKCSLQNGAHAQCALTSKPNSSRLVRFQKNNPRSR